MSVELLMMEAVKLEPHTSIKMHTHDFFQLNLIREGFMYLNLGGTSCLVRPGENILISAGTPHFILNSDNSPLKYDEAKFYVKSQTLKDILCESKILMVRDKTASSLIHECILEYSEQRAEKVAATEAYLSAALYMNTSGDRIRGDPDIELFEETKNYSQTTIRIIRFLIENHRHPISLDDISEYIGLSKNYLCNLFKEDTGSTIVTCLNLIRMKRAIGFLLLSPGLDLVTIAYSSGFGTINHMNRVFRSYAESSPLQIRKMADFSLLSKKYRLSDFP